jgi:hypothetical protein
VIRRSLHVEGIYSPELEIGLDRIRTDPASFQITDTIRTKPRDLFMYVCMYYQDQEPTTQKELLRRFSEEISDANGTCASGHMTRLLNILVGFHPQIHLSISNVEHAVIVWQKVLQQHLSSLDDDDNEDKILHDMTVDSTVDNAFIQWCHKHRQDLMDTVHHAGIEDDNVVYDAWNQMFPLFPDVLRPQYGCWDKILICFRRSVKR